MRPGKRGPFRSEIYRSVDAAARGRRVGCASEADCLSTAEARRWHAFHCGGCTAFRPLSLEQRAQDVAGLIMIARLSGIE